MIDKQPPLARRRDVELLPLILQRVNVALVTRRELFVSLSASTHNAPPFTALLESYDEHVTTAEQSEKVQFLNAELSIWGMEEYKAPPYELVLLAKHTFATLAHALFENTESVTETLVLADDTRPAVAVFKGLVVVTYALDLAATYSAPPYATAGPCA